MDNVELRVDNGVCPGASTDVPADAGGSCGRISGLLEHGVALASIGRERGVTMPRHAISADPADYPCGLGACDQTSVIVTTGNTRPTVFAHCADHLPAELTFPGRRARNLGQRGGLNHLDDHAAPVIAGAALRLIGQEASQVTTISMSDVTRS
jgi:hypothetical protein